MNTFKIVKGDLFKAPKGSIIVHACNTQGVWGSGIAKLFADRFPKAREIYSKYCKDNGAAALGRCLLIESGDYTVGCLFTSAHYGRLKDSPQLILKHTRSAVRDLIAQAAVSDNIAMCKINAGLFAVPWPDTQAVLHEFKRQFTVYEI
jgi:ADP-ribose 1''-phosphate phosphatase